MISLENITLEEKASVFDSHGYSLLMDRRIPSNLSVEETIVSVLVDSEPEPRLLEGIPVLIVKNKINYQKLKKLVDKYHLWNEFGYFGDFALKYFNNAQLKDLVNYCHTKLKPSRDILGFGYSFSKEFQKNEEKIWNLIGSPSYSSLEKQFRRYNG